MWKQRTYQVPTFIVSSDSFLTVWTNDGGVLSPVVGLFTVYSESTNVKDEFRLHCRTRSFVLYAEYEEEKDAWVSDLRNSIKGEHPSELQAKKDKQIIKREREKEEGDDAEKEKVKDKDRRRSQIMEPPTEEKKGSALS